LERALYFLVLAARIVLPPKLRALLKSKPDIAELLLLFLDGGLLFPNTFEGIYVFVDAYGSGLPAKELVL
jgi:hypothetical protein